MASLLIGGIIASVIFIAIGVVFALPPYIKGFELAQKIPTVLISFSITSDQNMPQWCQRIADLVEANQLKGAVYFSGSIAERYPDCVRAFYDGVDIGSSTYSYTKLSAERDYLEQLEDVRKGKAVIDAILQNNSTSFKAPYGYTDDNIYSLLSRNNIVADFSLSGSYNKYTDDIFVLYELKTLDLSKSSAEEIESQVASKVADHIQIVVDNSVPIEKVASLVRMIIEKHEATFVNASDLTGMNLMVRRQ